MIEFFAGHQSFADSRRWRLEIAGASLLLLLLALTSAATAQSWTLVFDDEFNAASGTLPNPANWSYDSPTAGSSNNELEIYCGQAGAGQTGDCSNWQQNAYQDGMGHLVIAAIKQADGQWTSARLLTHPQFTFTYGRAEASMELPLGAGLWPAFWMLGDNIFSGTNWPACGEEDMMEHVPQMGNSTIQSSLNGPGYNGGSSINKQFTMPAPQQINTAFHTYGVIWSPDLVQYYVDDPKQPFAQFTPGNMPRNGTWAFDGHPFFMILNLAVGGNWPGPPDASTPNPAIVLVDWAHVYQSNPGIPLNLSGTAPSRSSVSLSWTASPSSGPTYNVYRSTTNWFIPSSTSLEAQGVTGTSYTDTSVAAGKAYYYRVTAVTAAGESLPSNQAAVTTPHH